MRTDSIHTAHTQQLQQARANAAVAAAGHRATTHATTTLFLSSLSVHTPTQVSGMLQLLNDLMDV